MTMRDMRAEGFGWGTIARADSGELPRNRHTRAAYLKAIGLTKP